MSAALPPEAAPRAPLSLRLLLGGEVLELRGVPSDRTLLQVLREDLHCTAVKEGCASGDCGACTVAVAELGEGGQPRFSAVNSCIRLVHSVDGMAVWTAQDIAGPHGTPHPAQRAMLECHGSQCGFCSPGFVMSLYTLYRQSGGAAVTREEALHALSGNLCRCTGYRPIVDAALTMNHWPAPTDAEAGLLQQLQLLAETGQAPEADLALEDYLRPATLAELLRQRAAYPDALLVAGATDVGLWITKQHRRFARLIDVTRTAELRRVDRAPGQLRIGAAVPLEQAFEALAEGRAALTPFFQRFAGRPIRSSGTLGGNVANGSPIGDSMPVLIALGAQLVLASTRGERRLPIEAFYLGYRKTALAPDEVLARVEVALALPGETVHAHKISKRLEDDISAVCLALALVTEAGRITHARIGVGGVAATPARAIKTEASLVGQMCDEAAFDAAAEVLQAEFEPISDMRASSAYRRQMLASLLLRCPHERQAGAEPALFALTPVETTP